MNDPTCSRLDDYLDRELTPGEQAAFDAHLPTCADCRLQVELHQKTYALLRRATMKLEKPPQRLITAIESGVKQARRQRLTRVVPIASAAAVILIAISARFGEF